jgi:hypothetical protein
MRLFKKLQNIVRKVEPFPENQSNSEKLNWFKNTRQWNKVDEKILNAILNKYDNDPMIVVFVIFSMEHNLVPGYYKYNNTEYIDAPNAICSSIARTFFDIGANSYEKLVEYYDDFLNKKKKFTYHYHVVMDSMDTCIILEENNYLAYSTLASTQLLLNKTEDALKYAKQGLAIIHKLRDQEDNPFVLSEDENVKEFWKTANQQFIEVENNLNQIIAEAENV